MTLSLTRFLTSLIGMVSLCTVTACALPAFNNNSTQPPVTNSTHAAGYMQDSADNSALRSMSLALREHKDLTVAVAGDSTGALNYTWPRAWAEILTSKHPELAINFSYWMPETLSYAEPEQLGNNANPQNTLNIINGSKVGSTFEYHLNYLETIFPTETQINILILNMGHNYALKDEETFHTEIDTFLQAYKELHPESLIMVGSQNPEYAPVSEPKQSAHAQRQVSLFNYAQTRQYDYVDVYGTWCLYEDEGLSLMAGDGLHPSTFKPQETSLNDASHNGALFWAQIFQSALEAASD